MADDRLWDEYSLLQDKLDKIGDFCFRVKTWVTGIVGALLIGGVAAKLPPLTYLILLLPLLSFYLYEAYQRSWQSAFRARLREIESDLRRQAMAADPQVAKRWREGTRPQSIEHAIRLQTTQLKKTTFGKYFILRAHEWFYASTIAVVFLVTLVSLFRDSPNTSISVATTRPFEVKLSDVRLSGLPEISTRVLSPLVLATTQPISASTSGRVDAALSGFVGSQNSGTITLDRSEIRIVTTQPIEIRATTTPTTKAVR